MNTWLPAFLLLALCAAAQDAPDPGASLKGLEAGLRASPLHGGLMFRLAEEHARLGHAAEAKAWLGKALDTGIALDPEAKPAFDALRADPDYQALLARAAAGRQPKVASSLLRRMTAPDLGPEGIAYDPADRCWYLGSIRQRRILRVDADGTEHEFVASGRDGLMGVVGMAVDPVRRHLWVNTNPNENPGEDQGGRASRVFQLDLRTGRTLKSYAAPAGDHFLNDLTVGPTGCVYVTDSMGGRVYRIEPGAERLEVFCGGPGIFRYLNGLCHSSDRRSILVSDFLHGLSRIDLETRQVRPVGHPGDVSILGIDGLYGDGDSLLAVQNACGQERIVRYAMDWAGNRITGLEVLEQGHPGYRTPMTGAVSGRAFCFVAQGHPDAQATVVHRLKL